MQKKAYLLLSYFFGGYLLVYFINHWINNPILIFLQFIGGIFFMILGSGISISLIIQWLFKRNFNWLEFISIALLGGLIIPPAILSCEYYLLHFVYDWQPFANSTILWLIATIGLYLKKIELPKLNFSSKFSLGSPLIIFFTGGIILILILVFSYRTLPDLDPYKWLTKYTYQFANQQLDYLERPLFGALIFIGTRFTGLSILAFFKYIFPFIFLAIIPPAWMVAKTFANNNKSWLFLIFIFTSPVILLYGITPMPQAVLIILSYFYIFFLLYAHKTNNDFFLFSAGVIAFISFFFHQAGVILFAVWAVFIFIYKIKSFFSDKKTFILISLLVITNFSYFEKMWQFFILWANMVTNRIFSANNLNLLYPALYLNIDQNAVGWQTFPGVIKFYAFHMGPLVGAVILVFIIFFLKNHDFRIFFTKKILNPPVSIALVTFLLFFSIAEILPRFPNIALLPDRAWIFAGIFSLTLLYLMLDFAKVISKKSLIVSCLLLVTVASGSLYINFLKRYLITPAQLQSAQWIKKNLPKNRIFFTYGHKSLLPVYADSQIVRISSTIYCSQNIQDYENILNNSDFNKAKLNKLNDYYLPFLNDLQAIKNNSLLTFENEEIIEKKYQNAIAVTNTISEEATNMTSCLSEEPPNLSVIYPYSNVPNINSPIPIESVYAQGKISSFDSLKTNNMYIYFAKQHKLNPYSDRPYEMSTWGIGPCQDNKFLFDLYPNKFKRIYQTKDEEVIIWKIL